MLLHSSVITALAWSLMHQLPTHGACSSVTGLLKPMQTVKSHLGHCPVARIAVPHFRVPTGVRPVYSGMTVTEAATAETKPVTLVSFDVDGTLIHSIGKDANRLHKECFSVGFKEVFGLDTNIDVVEHHGSTDPLIVLKVLEHHGIPKEQGMAKLPEVQAAMTRHFRSQVDRAGLGLELLPGVQKLLETLKARDDVATCLVTGNLEPVGWGKMQALGIDHLFTQPGFGGFGSDLCSGNYVESYRDRTEFVKLAAERAQERFSGGVKACFHVGDTPMDIQAALGAGSTAVGVATGIFSREQLDRYKNDAPANSVVVLDSLEDLDAVLKVLRLH